eukprot:912957-Prymnesium_polylepis.4
MRAAGAQRRESWAVGAVRQGDGRCVPHAVAIRAPHATLRKSGIQDARPRTTRRALVCVSTCGSATRRRRACGSSRAPSSPRAPTRPRLPACRSASRGSCASGTTRRPPTPTASPHSTRC